MEEKTGYLVLSTGDVLEGKWLGDTITSEGELVFNTSMTGYQEVMTDPSYAGQIITMTYPLIGNYGINDADYESFKPFLSGMIVSHASHTPDHYESESTFQDMINMYNIPVLYDIDTRAVTRIIREHGEVYGKLTSDRQDFPESSRVDPDIVKTVSTQTIKSFDLSETPSRADAYHLVVFDFGYKHSIARTLNALGCRVTVVPFDTAPTAVDDLHPDAVIFSNGPGDPKDLSDLTDNIRYIVDNYPALGICLGHQLIVLAYGGETKRLPYGHRGSNHPVRHNVTGKVMITSQNHGYVVDEASLNKEVWQISYVNVNDQSVEGLIHQSKPIMTVQFHPEAHPGPGDTHMIFNDFISTISAKGEKQYA